MRTMTSRLRRERRGCTSHQVLRTPICSSDKAKAVSSTFLQWSITCPLRSRIWCGNSAAPPLLASYVAFASVPATSSPLPTSSKCPASGPVNCFLPVMIQVMRLINITTPIAADV